MTDERDTETQGDERWTRTWSCRSSFMPGG